MPLADAKAAVREVVSAEVKACFERYFATIVDSVVFLSVAAIPATALVEDWPLLPSTWLAAVIRFVPPPKAKNAALKFDRISQAFNGLSGSLGVSYQVKPSTTIVVKP